MTRFLTTSDVASALQVTPGTVCEWIRLRKLRGFRIGRGWRVSVEDFEAFIGKTYDHDQQTRSVSKEELLRRDAESMARWAYRGRKT